MVRTGIQIPLLRLQRPQFHGAAKGLHLLDRFHIRCHNTARPTIEDFARSIGIGLGDSNDRHQVHPRICLAHPGQIVVIDRNVFGVDEDEVEATVAQPRR